MQQQLSPKKYIQTRARTLPVYKCFVNNDWQDGGMANVFVLRRHVTGNLTAGVYLVDLLCLGIKDTFFFFNEPERDMMDRIPKNMFTEIDYPLAHNIIYAGHDFAMDFDIRPAKDFDVTKFLLDADADSVPLIEVHTGDELGKPHLIVESPGQYSEALAKLKKHAGEGGYRYTVAMALEDEIDDEDDDDDDEQEDDSDYDLLTLDDFPNEDILPLDAQYIVDEDLFDEEKINTREQEEQFTLKLEVLLRIVRRLKPELFVFGSVENLPEYRRHFTHDRAPILNGAGAKDVAAEEEAEARIHAQLEKDLVSLMGDKDAFHKKVGELLIEFGDDVRAVVRLFEILIVTSSISEHPDLVRYLQSHSAHFPLGKLIVALAALYDPEAVPGDYQDVYESSDISELFPEYSVFHDEELCVYWMIRLLVASDVPDLPAAIRFYALIAETEEFSAHLMSVQIALLHLLDPVIKAMKAGQESDD